MWKEVSSKYPSRFVGSEADGADFVLTEEDRSNHVHILGTTREGKSKVIEGLIRQDIDNGYGFTLLDPSAMADTANNVLKYAISKDYQKIVWIDINDHATLPTINPLQHWGKEEARRYNADSAVGKVMDSTRQLWGQTDWERTSRIQTYLPATLKALFMAGATIPDAVHFLALVPRTGFNPVLANSLAIRTRILAQSNQASEHRIVLEEVFSTRALHLNEYKATIRRLAPYFKDIPRLVFGSTRSPMNFVNLVKEKTGIIVSLNLSRTGGAELVKLIGSTVVNELVSAITYLTERTPWKGKHYLYIDEAGMFVTRALVDIMSYKGKTGLWATLAHQFDRQFEDNQIREAIDALCKIKIMFYTADVGSRDRMIKQLYWGEGRSLAESALAQLKKQNAVIKVNKSPATLVRIQDLPDLPVSQETVSQFKQRIYESHDFYRKPRDIVHEINSRFATASTPQSIRRDNLVPTQTGDIKVPRNREGGDHKPTRPASSTVKGKGKGSPDHMEQSPGQPPSQELHPERDVHADFTDASETAQRRRGQPKQGDKPEGK